MQNFLVEQKSVQLFLTADKILYIVVTSNKGTYLLPCSKVLLIVCLKLSVSLIVI